MVTNSSQPLWDVALKVLNKTIINRYEGNNRQQWDNINRNKDRLSRQKVYKEIMDLSYTLEQMDLTDVYVEHSIQQQQNTHSP